MKDKKRYIIRKYIIATSIGDALKLDRSTQADECWVDPEWLKLQDDQIKGKIGFSDSKNNRIIQRRRP